MDTSHDLRPGVLSAADITFMVVAAAAPMAVVVATMPLSFALGNGGGAVGGYALVALSMGLFAIGYVRLLPHVRNAGAFYAIVATAFGQQAGLAAAYVALASYVALGCATLGALAFFGADLLAVAGMPTPWWAVALATVAILAVLSYFRITLTAKILAVALIAEVAVILALDVAILSVQGFRLPPAALAPSVVFAPGLGVAIMYGFNSCIGFEGTAIYQEEARDRARSIPVATYAAIAIVGVFYVLTAWCFVGEVGLGAVAATAGRDPGHFVADIAERRLGGIGRTTLSVLVVTSAFAAVLGFFNNSARYVFALARDGVLPQALSRTGAGSGSPFLAGVPVLLVQASVVILFTAAGLDPLLALATALTGLGSVGLMTLLAITAFAVPVIFARRRELGWRTGVCPTLGGAMILAGVALTLANYDKLTGVDSQLINALPWGLGLLAFLGVSQAAWLRECAPAVFARIGSSRVED